MLLTTLYKTWRTVLFLSRKADSFDFKLKCKENAKAGTYKQTKKISTCNENLKRLSNFAHTQWACRHLTWEKLYFPNHSIHNSTAFQGPGFAQINSYNDKQNNKSIKRQKITKEYRKVSVDLHPVYNILNSDRAMRYFLPCRGCRRPSSRLHHKLSRSFKIMKLSWAWKSSIS